MSSKPLDPRGSHVPLWPMVALGVAVLTVAVALAVLLYNDGGGRAADDDAYWRENFDRLVTLKGEAEALAIAGELPAAHEKYREIERLVGGRHPKDPALWDLAERAKQDQDRIYALMLATMQAELAPGTTPVTPPLGVGAPSGPRGGAAQERLTITTQPEDLNPFRAGADAREEGEEGMSVTSSASSLAALTSAVVEQTRVPGGTSTETPPPPAPVAQATPAEAPLVPRNDALRPNMAALPAARGAADDELDRAIGRAIEKASNYLIGKIRADQIQLERHGEGAYLEGANALVVYALLQAGRTIPDERLRPTHPLMSGMLSRMKEHPILPDMANESAPVTYARSLRAAALAVYARPEDRKTLLEDVQWLVNAHADGAYTYRESLKISGTGAAPRINPFEEQHAAGGGELQRLLSRRSLFYIDAEKGGGTYLHNGEPRVPIKPPPGGYPPPGQLGNGIPGIRMTPMERFEPPELPWDNSNTQFGLLGVWAGAEAGVEVPIEYWVMAERHWIQWQLQTGEWEYDGKGRKGYYAMTVGGIASLLVTHDYLDAPALGSATGRQPYNRSLQAGLNWLESGDNAINFAHGQAPQFVGYNLFGLARVGLASGYKYFGAHDWYRALAEKVIASQHDNGAFGRDADTDDSIIDTAFTVLFLSRGRAPVMYNKLRFDGSWNNRARDLANLSLFATRELERQLNWQVVNLQREWHDWMDAPVLYLASHRGPNLSDADIEKLRAYANAGGLIFTHADGSAIHFNTFASNLARRLFPQYELRELPQSHEVYTVQYKMARKPVLRGVSNGSRLLMVHSPVDLTTPWQVRNGTKREAFELGVNLFVYAAGKTDLRNRLVSPYIAEPTEPAKRSVRVARLRYEGNWDPEPYAWERFSRHLRRQVGVSVDRVTLDLAELKPGLVPMAHLTGTAAWEPTAAEQDAIKGYVEAGGVLVIDACGGAEAFAGSAAGMLAKLFPGKPLGAIAPRHPLMLATREGMTEPGSLRLRLSAETKLGRGAAKVNLLEAGKGTILFTPLDLTTALLSTGTWGIDGFEPQSAVSILTNAVLWAEGR